MPPIVDTVPVKQRSITSAPSPSASKIWAPQYDDSVEMPIFEMILRRPFSAAARNRKRASSSIGGIGFTEIAEDVLARQRAAYPPVEGAPPALPDHGRVRYRRDGEDHAWSPPLVRAMQDAEIGRASCRERV